MYCFGFAEDERSAGSRPGRVPAGPMEGGYGVGRSWAQEDGGSGLELGQNLREFRFGCNRTVQARITFVLPIGQHVHVFSGHPFGQRLVKSNVLYEELDASVEKSPG
jgi:hypothetical protein